MPVPADLDNATLYEATERLLTAAQFAPYETIAHQLLDQFLNRCLDAGIVPPHLNISIQMAAAATSLYVAERLTDMPPNPARYMSQNYDYHIGQMRDLLLLHYQKAVRPNATLVAFFESLTGFFLEITKRLPALAKCSIDGDLSSETLPSIALIDILPNAGEIIEAALGHLKSPEANEVGLFRRLHKRLDQNLSDVSERSRSSKPPTPTTYQGTSIELVSAFLKNTGLERVFLESYVPVALPQETRFAGHWIIAPPGRGKTTLLHSMFLEDLKRDASIIIIDSKGDLIEPIKKLKAVADRLVLIEPDPEFPLALNPLDIPRTTVAHTLSLLEYVMSSLLEAKMTALQTSLFRKVLPAFVEAIPNATLETFRRVLIEGVAPYRNQLAKLPPDIIEFFQDKTHGFESKTYAETRNQLTWRLDFLLSNPFLKSMFASLKTKLDIGKEMDAGKIILINNSKALLGDEGAEFFGRFFIALILAAAQQRAGRRPEQKLPVYCYIDECHSVISRDPKIATILDECRSQKIALILAHQRSAQLTAPVLDAVVNCGIRFANSDDEAKFLADKLRTSTEFLYSLPRGTFAAFVRDLTPHALALKVPYNDLSALPQMTDGEQWAIKQRIREQFSSTPETRKAPAVALHQPAATAPEARKSSTPAKRTQTQSSKSGSAPDADSGTHTEPASKWGD